MSVAQHRIVAASILVCASLALVAVGRTMIQDSPEVVKVRRQLDGKWVATRVEATESVAAGGADAARTTVEFANNLVKLENLIEGVNSQGTYVIDPSADPGLVDFKVDAGWMLGIYKLVGNKLTLCVNAMKLPEQLGVPTRGRPTSLQQSPGRFLYEFVKSAP